MKRCQRRENKARPESCQAWTKKKQQSWRHSLHPSRETRWSLHYNSVSSMGRNGWYRNTQVRIWLENLCFSSTIPCCFYRCKFWYTTIIHCMRLHTKCSIPSNNQLPIISVNIKNCFYSLKLMSPSHTCILMVLELRFNCYYYIFPFFSYIGLQIIHLVFLLSLVFGAIGQVRWQLSLPQLRKWHKLWHHLPSHILQQSYQGIQA